MVNGEAVKKKVLQSDNDPLAEVKHFPLGHQILMGTLSQSERQDVPFLDLFQRYRAILTRLKQPTASKPQANAALAAMEQRGSFAHVGVFGLLVACLGGSLQATRMALDCGKEPIAGFWVLNAQ